MCVASAIDGFREWLRHSLSWGNDCAEKWRSSSCSAFAATAANWPEMAWQPAGE